MKKFTSVAVLALVLAFAAFVCTNAAPNQDTFTARGNVNNICILQKFL